MLIRYIAGLDAGVAAGGFEGLPSRGRPGFWQNRPITMDGGTRTFSLGRPYRTKRFLLFVFFVSWW